MKGWLALGACRKPSTDSQYKFNDCKGSPIKGERHHLPRRDVRGVAVLIFNWTQPSRS